MHSCIRKPLLQRYGEGENSLPERAFGSDAAVVRRERVAWLALMVSLTATASVVFYYRPEISRFLQANSRQAQMARAAGLVRSGEFEAAVGIYASLAERYPTRDDVLLANARILATLERDQEAEVFYQKAAHTGQRPLGPLREYVRFLEERHRPDEATAAYAEYVKQNGDDLTARLELGRRLATTGHLDTGESHLLAAAEAPALRMAALTALASAYFQQNRVPEAIDAWLKVAESGTEPATAVYWQDVARAYVRTGEWTKAADAWQRFLQVFPNSLTAAQALTEARQHQNDEGNANWAMILAKALAPGTPIELNVSTSATLAGLDRPIPEDPLTIELLFCFHANLTRKEETQLRFRMVPEGAGEQTIPLPVRSLPPTLGPMPFWRGDCLRQRFRLVPLESATPGPYTVQVSMGPDFDRFVDVLSIVITGEARP